jgi:quercetin dioxygenase-like cupin family protein
MSSPPDPDGGPRIESADTAPHYTWGDGCEGWRLLAADGLSVIEERMPGRTSETWHLHARSRQLFYVLSGELEVRLEAAAIRLLPGETVTIPPGAPHCAVNSNPGVARFLVISVPSTRHDRQPLDPPPLWQNPDVT